MVVLEVCTSLAWILQKCFLKTGIYISRIELSCSSSKRTSSKEQHMCVGGELEDLQWKRESSKSSLFPFIEILKGPTCRDDLIMKKLFPLYAIFYFRKASFDKWWYQKSSIKIVFQVDIAFQVEIAFCCHNNQFTLLLNECISFHFIVVIGFICIFSSQNKQLVL